MEFILGSGRQLWYAEARKRIEQAYRGASTDHQLVLSPPSILDMFGTAADPSTTLGSKMGSWVNSLPDMSITFDDFVSNLHALSLSDAYNPLNPYLEPAHFPSAQTRAAASSLPDQDFSTALRLLTINTRSLNDLGKIKFVFNQLQKLNTDIAFIQETRLGEHFNMPVVDGFHVVTAPAQAGHGGLLIAVRKGDHISELHHKVISRRVLVATFKIASRRCRLVCLHAPIAEAPACDHEVFASNVAEALVLSTADEVLLVGSDMNARLKGLHEDYSCVGDQAISECSLRAEFRHSCLTALSAAKMKAANTVLASPSHTTWRHPSGSEHQLDFIWVPEAMISRGKMLSCSVGAWGQFDCGTTSDHRHVEVVVMLQAKRACRSTRRMVRKAKFVNDAHIANYMATIRDELQPWDHQEPVADYIEKMNRTVTDTVLRTAPKRSPQRKPWLTPVAWDAMHSLNLWRRYCTALRRGDSLLACSLYVRLDSPKLEFSDGSWLTHLDTRVTDQQYILTVAAKVKEVHTQVRKLLRSCRKDWLRAACTDIDEHRKNNSSRLLHKAVKYVCSTSSHRGSRLLKEGAVWSDADEVASIWLQHWQTHFNAVVVGALDFLNRHAMTPASASGVEDEEPFLQFEPTEVARVLSHLPSWKATADPFPAPALTGIAELVAEPLCHYFNNCARARRVPAAYSGAKITPVFKKKGSAYECSSYRPVALLCLEAKLLAKLCLERLGPVLRFHASQFGSGHTPGVLLPQILVLQAAAVARSRRQASSTVFIDVIGAFDSVPLPLLWDENVDHGCASKQAAFEQRGFSGPDAASMSRYLEAHPCILDRVGVPRSVVSLLRSWGSYTWIMSSMELPRAVRPHTGVLQGQNLAGLLFDVFYSALMDVINTKLGEDGIGILLPVPQTRSLQLCPTDLECEVGTVAYRDDLALPLAADTNDELIKLIGRAVRILESAHQEFHLHLNYSRGKSECVVHLQAPSAKGYMQGLKMVGKASGLSGPAIPVHHGGHILLAQEYPHLGRSHAQSGSLRREVTCRVAKATSAFKQYRRVLTSPHVVVGTRVSLFLTYVACHLLQHAAVTPRLGHCEYHRLRSCYMQLLRKTLSEVSNAFKVSPLTDGEVCANFRTPTFLSLWDRRRLKALPKLLTTENTALRALFAAYMGPGSIWSGFFDTLARFRACKADRCYLPTPSELTFSEWCQFVITHHDTWSDLVKSHSVADPPRRQTVSAELGASIGSGTVIPEGEDMNEDCGEYQAPANEVGASSAPLEAESASIDDRKFPCPLCTFGGKTAAGLAMHSRRKHGLQSPLSIRLRTAQCPACLMWCENRNRALDHLKDSKRCGRYVLDKIEPIPEAEFQAILDRERSINHLWTRQMTPKAGPKPPGYRPPLNVVTPLFAAPDHELTATSIS
eukprot:3370412-Amphidinium_carterae.1